MKCITDFTSVNLSTGEKTRHVVGDGQRIEECWMHRRLGPPPWYPHRSQEEADKAREQFIDSMVAKFRQEKKMHYKNGREAKNGDKVVVFPNYGSPFVGILYDATAGNDYCNGKIAVTKPNDQCPNLKECLHLDDVLKALPAEVPDSSKT